MEFGIEKCTMLAMKSGKRHLTDGRELPNQDKIRTFAENETYKYLSILESDTHKQMETKDAIQKNISGELKTTRDKTVKPKHYQRNKHLGCTAR